MQQREYIIARQLLRCSTSIGANVEEATAASSRRDFVQKMSIASKKARENRYWLRLIQQSGICDRDLSAHLADIAGIINILTKIIKTTNSPKQD